MEFTKDNWFLFYPRDKRCKLTDLYIEKHGNEIPPIMSSCGTVHAANFKLHVSRCGHMRMFARIELKIYPREFRLCGITFNKVHPRQLMFVALLCLKYTDLQIVPNKNKYIHRMIVEYIYPIRKMLHF